MTFGEVLRGGRAGVFVFDGIVSAVVSVAIAFVYSQLTARA
jgi:hypothetical protein